MGRYRAKDSCLTASRATRRGCCTPDIVPSDHLAELLRQGLLHSCQSKEALLAKTCNLSCSMGSVDFNWRGLWWAVPVGAGWRWEAAGGSSLLWGQHGTNLHGDKCSTLCRGDSLFLMDKNHSAQKTNLLNICHVSHPSRLSYHTEHLPWSPTLFCHGGGSWVTQQNPTKVSLPLVLRAVYLCTNNDHHITLESCMTAYYVHGYNNTVKYLYQS